MRKKEKKATVKGSIQNIPKLFFAIVAITAVVAFAVTALLINIFERKQEAKNPFFKVVEVNDDTEDPEIWGKNFPLQYDAYKRTVDMVRTRYGGSEAMPKTPDNADPRSIVANSRLEEDPRLVTMWAGYAFSKDFREERGHAYMLEDQIYTERQRVVQQPGTCIHCHASTYIAYKKLGNGNITLGFEKLNQMKYQEARTHVKHPVSCIDCHDPQTMQLRITRPALLEGLKVLKEREGIKDYNPNRSATHQEMRSLVCAQCHVEYYFKGKEKRLVYPWANGIKADDILDYYEKAGFKDWTHSETGAPSIKVQHPEFELWSQGIHSRSGVSCADCHMPYTRVGALKISDHHIRSPLLKINNSCQTCHKFSESEIKARAEENQSKIFELRNLAMNSLMDLIDDIQKAKNGSVKTASLKRARSLQRKAQFLLDFIEVENSSGFHAPPEAARILALSVDYSRRGQLALKE